MLPTDIQMKVHTVIREPTWRQHEYALSYLLINRAINANELISILAWAVHSELPNPRVISPNLLQWSSLFHPRFYRAVHGDCPVEVVPLSWCNEALPGNFRQLSRFWLQSLLFLSGVTLSAAVIQHRFSSGTIGSKLDQLWVCGALAHTNVANDLQALHLHNEVLAISQQDTDDVSRLLAVRSIYMQALSKIAPADGCIKQMHCADLTAYTDGRFDFAEGLKKQLGDNLKAIVVYGSSVLSDNFADIDAIVIVENPTAALLKMSGTSPTWVGKELNLGVYSPAEFLVMQRLSGDNLLEYGLCIWGELEVVQKPVPSLLARNFSFGVIRQRQQFGMLSREMVTRFNNPDRTNLQQYFVKIPANVTKGTLGAVGRQWSKEKVHAWLHSEIGFDTNKTKQQAVCGEIKQALAHSALATGNALLALNARFNVVQCVEPNHYKLRKTGSD